LDCFSELVMQIFFDRRVLRILKPDEDASGEILSPGSRKEVRQLIHRFDRDPTQTEIFLRTADYKQLKKRVKACFTLVKAAGGLVKNECGEILFIYRRGRWDLPKGKLDPAHRMATLSGQTSRKAFVASEAIREVKEETGLLDVSITKKLPSTFHVYHEKGFRMLKQTVWFEMRAPSGQQLIPQTDEDILYVRWFKPGELGIVLQNTHNSLREMITSLIKS